MSVRALMRCNSVNTSRHVNPDNTSCTAAQVSLAPQYVGDPAKRPPENEIFGKATPSGQITMYITNEFAWKQFEEGKFYYVDFSEAAS